MKYFPLHVHSAFSLLDGVSQPKTIANRLVECDLAGSAITDHGNIFGALKFVEALKKKNKKPILGCELYICEQHSSIQNSANKKLLHLIVLAKNLEGWRELIKIISNGNRQESFYRKPRLSLEEIQEIDPKNLIAISGHLGSHMAHSMFVDTGEASRKKTITEIRQYLHPNCVKNMESVANRLQDIFGNFFLEIQLVDKQNLPINQVIADGLRYIGKKLDIPRVATPDAHYCRREDAEDQRMLLCTSLNRKIKDVYRDINNGLDVPLSTFFISDNYHIPNYGEMLLYHNAFQDELENTLVVADLCEDYDITNPPDIPRFNNPDNISSEDYTKKLVKIGFNKKQNIINDTCKEKNLTIEDYRQRYQKESQVIFDAKLADYFLILQDILEYARNNGQLVGAARGSSAGCLMSYLIDITEVDPLKHDLLFERFYNSARAGSLPDIDIDVEKFGRIKLIEYIEQKYGKDRVAKIATFGRLQGKAVIKDVFKNHGISFDEVNEITKFIPDESKITDQIQEQHDAGNEDYGIIDWALDHNGDKLSKWVTKDEESGKLSGPLSNLFEQAIRLEGCYKSLGVHAAGIIISNRPITEVCALVRSSDGELITTFDKKDVEKVGLCKLDLLGLSTLDRVHIIQDLINETI